MTSDVEPAKKILLPYLQRADELQKHEPLVAYYCRLYAMERGLKIPVKERTKTTNAILVSLMNQLEKDKKTVQLSTEDNLYVEGFALSVFAKADKQDRAGRADLNTAKTFYAASIFIEILHQFGQLQPDIEQKQKYAVWKAADIRKALSEGRKPVPGPPGGDDDLSASHELLDSEVSPQSAAPVELQGRSSIQHKANDSFEIPASSLDGASKMNTSPPTHHDHQYASIPDQRTGEQPTLDFAGSSGYASGYPGSYHRAPSMPGYTPSSMASSHHGSMDVFSGYQGSLDGFSDGQHHSAALHKDYLQTSISGQMYSGVPTGYDAANGTVDGGYYQHQGHAPSTVAYPTSSAVAYPASAPFSADYSSIVGSSDPSGLARTTSAPTSSVKVQDYQPTPEKIAEAQKAARFAVSALAFDDVVTAVSYLKQSLELLTNPAST